MEPYLFNFSIILTKIKQIPSVFIILSDSNLDEVFIISSDKL